MRLKTFSFTLEFSNSNPRCRWAPAETSSEDVFSAKAFTAKSMVFEHAIYGGFVCRLAWIFDDLTDSIINSRPWKTPQEPSANNSSHCRFPAAFCASFAETKKAAHCANKSNVCYLHTQEKIKTTTSTLFVVLMARLKIFARGKNSLTFDFFWGS